jgi:outer membrane protein assembly factor BamB
LRQAVPFSWLALAVLLAACRPSSSIDAASAEPVELPPGAAEMQARTELLPPPAPPCASDAWTTYAHDAARTSASGGCLWGPLRLAWSATPRSFVDGSTLQGTATRAIADDDAVYVAGKLGPVPSLWRMAADSGKSTWGYESHTEAPRGGWPTLASLARGPSPEPAEQRVYLVDDGVNYADAATGRGRRAELDAWGESVSDGERLFAENNWYLDGYGLYVSAFDMDLELLWRRDYNALSRGYQVPDVGGLALADGLLVHASQHGVLGGTALSAFDPRTGERKWRAAVSPQSSPSIAGGRVYAVERWPGEKTDRLVARDLATGALAWATELADARGPAPVLAGHLVVMHAADAVVAFDATTGDRVWTAGLPRTAPPVQSSTTLAAAMGSRTLVVVTGTRVHVVRLDDGAELWGDAPVPHAKRIEGPVVVGHSLYLVADGRVVRLDGSDER